MNDNQADDPAFAEALRQLDEAQKVANVYIELYRLMRRRTVPRLRRQVVDLRATEAVLRGEIRRADAALATFDAVVAERDGLRAQVARLRQSAAVDDAGHLRAQLAEAERSRDDWAARVVRVEALCDRWDATTRGETPLTTGPIRAAIEGDPEAAQEPARCPACAKPAEVPGEGRFCGACQDYEGTCADDHCMSCGAST